VKRPEDVFTSSAPAGDREEIAAVARSSMETVRFE
jgi:hypothetical protein